MELSIRLVTQPSPTIRARIVVLIIFIVAVMAFRQCGCEPGIAVSLVLSTGLGAVQTARALARDAAPGRLAAGSPHEC